MRKSGIREARQNLSALIEEVKGGHEVLITKRGKPIARLVPFMSTGGGFPNLSALRRRMPAVDPLLSHAILDDRENTPAWPWQGRKSRSLRG